MEGWWRLLILDTSVLVDLLRGDKDIEQRIRGCEERREPLRTTSISSFELYYGAYNSSMVEENLSLVADLLRALDVLEFDEKASKIAGSILVELRKEDREIGLRDLFIVAVALSVDETVATRDKAFEKVRGLKVEFW